ncbi:unnamed protein product [Rangifer tarandus platyrhynchus]|uniref:Uncharacterized protein n=1 Tax=Rangifer tarandus platyrhynchus TaxID=3082113 RepID=A0AC59ZDL2_RANTA
METQGHAGLTLVLTSRPTKSCFYKIRGFPPGPAPQCPSRRPHPMATPPMTRGAWCVGIPAAVATTRPAPRQDGGLKAVGSGRKFVVGLD